MGKFGRVLGTLHVYPDDLDLPLNVNDTLVKEGYAVEYWGGKKKSKEKGKDQNEDVPFAD